LLAAIPLGIGVIVTVVLMPDIRSEQHIPGVATEDGFIRRGMDLGGLFTRKLNVAYLFQFLLFISSGIGASIWSLYMLDRGASLPVIGLSYTTFALPIVFLAPTAGRFSDRYGRYRPLLLGLLLCAITFSIYYFPLTAIWIVLVSVLEGISLAIVRAAVDGYVADVMPGDRKGKVQATYNAAGTAGSLFGSVAAGILYLHSSGLPFLMEGMLYLVTLLCALSLPGLRHLLLPEKLVMPE
jgi:MFS family permease